MKIVQAGAMFEGPVDGMSMLRHIEAAGRTCYKSEVRAIAGDEETKTFVKKIMDRGHLSVIEHCSVSVRFIVDRGVSHEIVRHRLVSYSQESTRYCNYAGDRFGGEIAVIDPRPHMQDIQYIVWVDAMKNAEECYFDLVSAGAKPQMARSVLPNSLKTELVMTANLREWRHFFQLRCAPAAHPQMREVAIPLLQKFVDAIPVIFDDFDGLEG